jgi:uncharacterized protein (DUF2235 family)
VTQPIHTPGELSLYRGRKERDASAVFLKAGSEFVGKVYGHETSKETAEANARLLAAAYNAFDSAGRKLGLNAVQLAERMADGGLADLIQAVRAAKEMSDWFMKHSRQADHAFSELKQPLHETAGWKELVDSGYNGLMASYHGQFEEALAKVKGGAS